MKGRALCDKTWDKNQAQISEVLVLGRLLSLTLVRVDKTRGRGSLAPYFRKPYLTLFFQGLLNGLD
jgi:hypothetical protein